MNCRNLRIIALSFLLHCLFFWSALPAQDALPGFYPDTNPDAPALQGGQRLLPQFEVIRPGQPTEPISPLRVLATSSPVFDWSNLTPSPLTPVKNQGNTGTCWIFASISTVESGAMLAENLSEPLDYSEQDVGNFYASNSFLASGVGGNAHMVASYLSRYGAVDEADEPWTGIHGTWNPNNPYQKNITQWRFLGNASGGDAASINSIKNALMHGPVYTTIASAAISSWASGNGISDWGSIVVPNTVAIADPKSQIDHGVVIVGWDDNMLQHGGGATGAWRVRNSWGPHWGDNGYSWIGYGAGAIGYSSSYYPTGAIEDRNPRERILSHDLGWDGVSLGWSGTYTVYMASRFTVPSLASGENFLHAVDVAAPYQNLQVEIRIYSDFNPNTKAPVGSPIATQSQTLSHSGMYSIALNNPVPVITGQTICIWLKVVEPAYSHFYLLPLSETSTNQSGVCFISSTGANGHWLDLSASQNRELVLRGRIAPSNALSASTQWILYE